MTKSLYIIAFLFFLCQQALGNVYYVSTTGNDVSGDGSSANPWKTLKHAVTKVPANQGHTIEMGAGTFVESGQIEIPVGVNIAGAGKDATILKAASSFYYHPASPGYAIDKFLISLKGTSPVDGNQSLKRFTIDGDSKQLHGAIYVRYRNRVIIDEVRVQNTNFTGIWLWDVKDSKIINSELINCSWGSTGYCSGALNLGSLERVEIDRLYIDESVGYGIKAIGPDGHNKIIDLKIHDSRVSVNPYGLWENGKAPNIAIELWSVNLVGCEIYNTYVDNTISLVNSNSPPATGIQSIRVHHNTIDMDTRAKGAGYGIELSINDAEIDHNYFIKGRYGIAHWDNFVKNWNIHHNVFYALENTYPGDVLRSQRSGLHNVNFYNNTIEFTGDKTMNAIGLYAGTSENVSIINNLFINSNTSYSYYPNSLVRLENGAVLNNLVVKNNLFDRLAVGSVVGTYTGNLSGDPKITKAGSRPDPYYVPTAGSPLIDAGLNIISGILDPIIGAAPDIGAYEYTTSMVNQSPQVKISSPANNSSFTAGSSISLTANASDSDGTISKVEFFQGSTLLGTDTSSPYNFNWADVPAGTYSLTCKATDNAGASATSAIVSVNVKNGSLPSPWRNSDMGQVGAAGSASYSNATFTLWGSGSDIWDIADEFQFVYQGLSGNGSIVAKVNSLTNTHAWAKAGVMIRESLNANSAHAMSVITPSSGVSFQNRSATGNTSVHTTLAGHTAPKWLKIERSGNTFTSSYSSDGVLWTVIGTTSISMGADVYIGLCTTSHADGVVATASFSQVSVAGQVPPPWQNRDIGMVAAAGSSTYNNGSFTVRGSGVDIWDTADEFQFVYQNLNTDGSLVAQVNSLTYTHAWAKAGVMIRESLNADSKYAMSVVTPSNGVSFQARETTAGYSKHMTLPGESSPKWLKIERSANTFTSSFSSDGTTWTVIGTRVVNMAANVYVGLCVTSHADGIISTASFSDVSIARENARPQISITSPAAGANFASEIPVTITADASDNDGTISRVEFFNGTTKVGEDLASPYSFDWTNVPAGSYSLTAKATDNKGATALSEVVNITVTDDRIMVGLYAPDAALAGNMKLTSDPTASKGSYFSMPAGYGTNHYIPPSSSAQFSFELEKPDTYVAWVRLRSPSTVNQGYHIYDGKGNWTSWLAGVHTDWTWVKVINAYTNAVATFPYTAGLNVFRMAWFHESVHVDRILLTNDLHFIPSDKEAVSNGRKGTSTLTSLEMETNNGFDIFPNPVKDNFVITYTSTIAQEARITIQSANSLAGKEMMVPLTAGINNISVKMDNDQNGVYIVTLLTSHGETILRKIVVVN